MNKKIVIFNVICLVGLIVAVTLLSLYQIFVSPNYQRISLLDFLSPQNFIAATEQVRFSVPAFTTDSPPQSNLSAFPECTQFCEIVIYDLEQKKVVRRVPAFTDADKKPNISDLSLDFFDPEKGLLGYHSETGSQLYVIDYDLNLLQDIRLDNERNTVKFIGYFPASQQLLFRLIEKDGKYDQLALYAANRPSLHLLQKIQPTDSVSILSESNGYTVGTTVFDLSGNPVPTAY